MNEKININKIGKKSLIVNRRTANKKGVIFTATIGLFLVLLLIFAVFSYEIGEQNEIKTIPISLATRILSIEDSIQQSMKDIFLTDTNLTVDIQTPTFGITTIDRTVVKAKMLSSNQPLKLEDDIDSLNSLITSKFNDVTFDVDAIKSNLVLERSNGTRIEKTLSDTIVGGKDILIIYYNYSGRNKGIFYEINITINSTSDMRNILNTSIDEPPQNPLSPNYPYKINITINDINYVDLIGGIEAEDIDGFKSIKFSPVMFKSYTWVVNNSDNTTTFMNITLDIEKVTITCDSGSSNVTAEIYNGIQTNTDYFYFAPEEAITIELPKYHTKKVSRVAFR